MISLLGSNISESSLGKSSSSEGSVLIDPKIAEDEEEKPSNEAEDWRGWVSNRVVGWAVVFVVGVETVSVLTFLLDTAVVTAWLVVAVEAGESVAELGLEEGVRGWLGAAGAGFGFAAAGTGRLWSMSSGGGTGSTTGDGLDGSLFTRRTSMGPAELLLDMCPKNASYYGNRAATLMMLSRHREALEDSQQAVRLDDTFMKGHLREGKCHLSLGNAMAASRCFHRVLELEPDNSQAQQEVKNADSVLEYEKMAELGFEKHDFRMVVFCMDRALESASACHRFKVLKAECLAMLGRYPEAQSVASDILRMDATNGDALYVRGLCLYYEDCIDKAVQFFVQALRMAPDHEKARLACRNAKALKAKKEDGNKAFKDGNYDAAYELYSEALTIDPNNIKTNAKLFCNRGTVGSKLNKIDQAIEDCTKAVKLDETYIKAYLRRAQCYMDKEEYDEAVRDYEKVYQTEKTKEHKHLLKNAQLELKKSKRKDYYKVLGVDKNATEDEIKKAYRKRALMHHPDRHSSASAEIQKEEEKKFKEVGEAFTVLSDPKKKSRYDSGHDLEDDTGNMGADFDANNIFKAFFGGGGGQGYSFEANQSSGPGNFFFQFG